jgi:hypothetical protein
LSEWLPTIGLAALGWAVLCLFCLWFIFMPPRCKNGCGRTEFKEGKTDPRGQYIRVYICPKCGELAVTIIPFK